MQRQLPPMVSLRAIREARGWDSRELARSIQALGQDIHPDTVLSVELGHKPASQKLLRIWVKALGLDNAVVLQERDILARISPDTEAFTTYPDTEVAETVGADIEWLRRQMRQKRVSHLKFGDQRRMTDEHVKELLKTFTSPATTPVKAPEPARVLSRRKRK